MKNMQHACNCFSNVLLTLCQSSWLLTFFSFAITEFPFSVCCVIAESHGMRWRIQCSHLSLFYIIGKLAPVAGLFPGGPGHSARPVTCYKPRRWGPTGQRGSCRGGASFASLLWSWWGWRLGPPQPRRQRWGNAPPEPHLSLTEPDLELPAQSHTVPQPPPAGWSTWRQHWNFNDIHFRCQYIYLSVILYSHLPKT